MANFPSVQPNIPQPNVALGHKLNTPGFELDVLMRRVSDEVQAIADKLGYSDFVGAQTPVANGVLASLSNGTTRFTTVTTQMLVAEAATKIISAIGSTSGPTTTSASFVTVPEMSVTFTTQGGPVKVDFDVTAYMAAPGVTIFQLQVDGAAIPGATKTCGMGTVGDPIHLHGIATPAAGSHTFRAVWAVVSGTAAAAGVERILTATEFKR